MSFEEKQKHQYWNRPNFHTGTKKTNTVRIEKGRREERTQVENIISNL